MGEVILWELRFVWISICLGLLLRGAYDFILIIRQLIKHSDIIVGIEDFIFWIICCLQVFELMYKQNNGTIRGFACIGVFLGMGIYHFGPSSYIVSWITILIKKIVIFIGKPVKIIKKPLKILRKKVRIKIKQKKKKRSEGDGDKT